MDEPTIDDILHKGFLPLHNVDPETHQQWLRLQRAMAQSETQPLPIRSRFIPRFALGAAAVAIATVGAYVYFSFTQGPDTFATGRGERQEIVLDDGSQATLSYATELVVQKQERDKPRRVTLTGEAYFRVQPRQVGETPFIVSTQYADVEVVGTEFNLRTREGALEVAVIDGTVKVSVAKEGSDSTLLLTQHQMALVPQNDFPRRIGNIPSLEYPGWMHGKLFLNRTSFLDAIREIEMRFDVTITIEDRNVRSELLTGILDAKTATSAVAALCELTGKSFTHEGEKFRVY